jgi:DNA polymerase III subunit gamma/tau
VSEKITVEPDALQAVARLANGGMRDAQSILDQMISFCGEHIAESDVMDVYGLASASTVQGLANALAAADYPAIMSAVDALSADGRDLFRVLTDLAEYSRAALLDSIKNGGTSNLLGREMGTESLLRMQEALHDGTSSVQRGLSERVNFEIALFKAVEASRSRAIDEVIRELSAAADSLPVTEAEKKTP